jgi:hypothetical protein
LNARWPIRTRICLECRAALSDGEHCTWVRHTAVAPADPAGRQRLLEAVWPAAARQPPLGQDVSSFRGWLETKILQPLSSPDWSSSRAPEYEVPPPPRLREGSWRTPRGASEEPLWTSRTSYRGRVIESADTLRSPIGHVPCVAYGLWLIDPRADGSPVLLRDGATLRFDVELDDGRAVRVPAGSADMVGPGVRVRARPSRLAEYLARLDPAPGAPRQGRSPLPFRRVHEAVLVPGDRFSLLADLESVADGRAPARSAYREPAAAVLTPVGRVVLAPGIPHPATEVVGGRRRES